MPFTDKMPQFKGNCLITNYKPSLYNQEKPEEYKEKKHNKNDINIFVEDGQMQELGITTKEAIMNSTIKFTSVFNTIASLAGDKDVVEAEDFKLIKTLKGKLGIEKTVVDLKNAVARLIFDNGEQLRIDFETATEKENPNVLEEDRLRDVKTNEAAYKKVEELKKDSKINKYFDIEIQTDAENNFTGNVTLTMKKDLDTVKIREILNLSDGALTYSNEEILEQKFQKQKGGKNHPGEADYDNLTVYTGETLYIENFFLD